MEPPPIPHQKLLMLLWFSNLLLALGLGFSYYYRNTHPAVSLAIGMIVLIVWALALYIASLFMLLHYLVKYTGAFGRWIAQQYTTRPKIVVGAGLLIFFILAFFALQALLSTEKAIELIATAILGGVVVWAITWWFAQRDKQKPASSPAKES